jgi:hypothetical protein
MTAVVLAVSALVGDANGPTQWGPSLYTLMHTDYLSQLGPQGYLSYSYDNDSGGVWLFDDETALAGLAAYRYIATRIGDQAEARWAASAYTSLLNATNAGIAANETVNNFDFLPCEVNQPVTADRCDSPNDANWASQARGDWPVQGTQWVELDWSSPVTTNGADAYFADDGGGLRLPASWTVQYWNGSAFVDVPAPGSYPAADNTFNHVSFGSITTTKLRLVMVSGLGSVGVIQWVVPSIPAT